VQGWGRQKKRVLIKGQTNLLNQLSECKNDSHSKNLPFDSAQGTDTDL